MIDRLRAFPATVRHRWRGSLQLRVAATTLVLSLLVSVLVGVVLMRQIRDGLLNAKVRSSLVQLDFGLQHAADQYSSMDRSNPNALRSTTGAIIGDLGRGSEVTPYGLALLAADPRVEGEATVRESSIPRDLRQVVGKQGRQAWTYTTIVNYDGTREPGLVVGGPVPANTPGFQLYYLFPLTQERQTLGLVKRTMLLGGAAIVLLLVVITVVVARQVVRPVRQAAATAERLAAGRLRDRMRVRGEDDLASLATSFNRMAETVERQISQLRELSRVQRRFVADVSHELRTPITTIRMAADVLHASRDDLPGEVARSSELLQTQLDRFEALLADLLEISRHDAGAVALDTDTIDLRSLVSGVVDAAGPLAESRSCTIALDLPDQPVVAEVDARRVQRVLRNLLANAVEHGEGRPVEVALRGGPGGVAITVRDYGAGLRPGEAALVFGRFWRADPARARTSGGTGLGLSIALEDARLHGGWLQAWGHPGDGSVFRLTLPWRAGEHVTESPLPLDPHDRAPAPSEVADA
ncbi:MAG TPA: MtrAB system histidine kinase MtrB [Mycobacteriales bacterium]|nr:MtrAB system histidine kinase MtrB [Mycobacteriales bacterium]